VTTEVRPAVGTLIQLLKRQSLIAADQRDGIRRALGLPLELAHQTRMLAEIKSVWFQTTASAVCSAVDNKGSKAMRSSGWFTMAWSSIW
jgi:hypothetical protein